MPLLDDIQAEILDDTRTLGGVLRKALVLAHSLRSPELKEWVEAELNGYGSVEELPEYRKITTQSVGHFFGPFHSELRSAPIAPLSLPKVVSPFYYRCALDARSSENSKSSLAEIQLACV